MTTHDTDFVVFGNQSEAVFRNIWRKKNNLPIFRRNGNFKLGLIIEGGGMRGVIAGGIVVALHKLGLNKIFDNVYGSSAGALGGAYFLSGQAPYGISIYYEVINNKNFINLYRVPAYFNIDYLIQMVKEKKILDIEAVKNNPASFTINATDIESGKPVYFTDFSKINLLDVIKASCALPIYYDKPVEINGRKYLDGGIVSPLPIRKTLEDGCTDILILMTSAKKRPQYTKLPFWFQLWRLHKYGRNFISAYYARQTSYKKTLNLIEGEYVRENDIHIAAIAPNNQKILNTTINTKKIKNACRKSYDYALNLIKSYQE